MKVSIKFGSYALIAALVAGASVCLWINPAPCWPRSMLFGAVAGTVATTIFLRFIFMNLLFHPQKPGIFGLQGIVPAIVPKVSIAVGSEAEKLLSAENIILHVERHHLVEETVDGVAAALTAHLVRQDGRDELADAVHRLYMQYRSDITVFLNREAKGWLSDFVTKIATEGELAQVVKLAIMQFLESEPLQHKARDWVVHELIEKSPDLFFSIYSQLSGILLRNQSLWKKTVLKLLGLYGLDEKSVQAIMLKILEAPETTDQTTRFITNNIHLIEGLFEQDFIRAKLIQLAGWLNNVVLDEGNITVLDEKVEALLKDDASRQALENFLLRLIEAIQSRLKDYFARPEGLQSLRTITEHIVPRLKVQQLAEEKIKSVNLDIIEMNVRTLAGEYLAFLEICGGVLGAFAGFVMCFVV